MDRHCFSPLFHKKDKKEPSPKGEGNIIRSPATAVRARLSQPSLRTVCHGNSKKPAASPLARGIAPYKNTAGLLADDVWDVSHTWKAFSGIPFPNGNFSIFVKTQ